MGTHRVLVTDKLAEEGLASLRAEPGIEVVVNTKLAQDSAGPARCLETADGIVIRSGTQLTAEILENQPRLKAIVRAGVGVDNIDVAAATRRGIVVMNTPGGNTDQHRRADDCACCSPWPGMCPPPTPACTPASGSAAISSAPARWQDSGHRRPGPGRPRGRPPGRGSRHEGGRLRPVPVARQGAPSAASRPSPTSMTLLPRATSSPCTRR